MIDYVSYFIATADKSTHPFPTYGDASDALPMYLDQHPKAQLVCCQPYAAAKYISQPLLKLTSDADADAEEPEPEPEPPSLVNLIKMIDTAADALASFMDKQSLTKAEASELADAVFYSQIIHEKSTDTLNEIENDGGDA